MLDDALSWQRWGYGVGLILVIIGLIAGTGVASAAVSGSFSSSYDGWDDGSSSDTTGHEIAVSGTVEVTGDSAVNPRIVVRGSEHAIIDKSSVRVFVEGDRSIEFNRVVQDSRVVYQADEIPAGTTLQVEYMSYYKGSAGESGNVTVGNVDVNYETPGGSSQQESFATTNQLENRPEQVISDLKTGGNISQIQQYLSYLGGLFILYIVFRIGSALRGENGIDDDSGI